MTILSVPYGLTTPRLRNELRRYFGERYNQGFTVDVYLVSRGRCYAKVRKVVDRERNASGLRVVERTFEFDIYEGHGNMVMEGFA